MKKVPNKTTGKTEYTGLNYHKMACGAALNMRGDILDYFSDLLKQHEEAGEEVILILYAHYFCVIDKIIFRKIILSITQKHCKYFHRNIDLIFVNDRKIFRKIFLSLPKITSEIM